MSKKIDGKHIAKQLQNQLKEKINKLEQKPGLAAILVGDNPASKIYISLKEKRAKEIGMYFEKHIIDSETANTYSIEKLIQQINQDKNIHGIIVQLPLPSHIDTQKIINTIDPKKDADGFHPETIKNLGTEREIIKPVMAEVIIEVFRSINDELRNRTMLIIGNSKRFLKPLEKIFTPRCKRVITASKKNFQNYSQEADKIIIAVGKAHILKPEHIKKDSVLIDIGINKLDGKIVGDIDPACYSKAKYYTPVPGGIGPITVVKLLENTYKLSIQNSL